MIDVTEHFYDDDPAVGHPDVRTRLAGVSYFFLGNGLIQAAVQFAPAGEGTPLGLLVMNPERLAKKRHALTQDGALGLEPTQVRVAGETPSARELSARWLEGSSVPTVVATWRTAACQVEERFSCPNPDVPSLQRMVTVRPAAGIGRVSVSTGAGVGERLAELCIDESGSATTSLVYTLSGDGNTVSVQFTSAPADLDERAAPQRSHARFSNDLLDRWFAASVAQLPAVVSRHGRVDASLWQYNREWVRDQAWVALALVLAGHGSRAATIFERLLRDFITPDGSPVDSSEVRASDEVELDQNGVLLCALHAYVNWTGDAGLVGRWWDRIEKVAEFPLKAEFRDSTSGLLHNCREFWERDAVHGIEPGFELAHQVFVSVGLRHAAALARLMRQSDRAARWEDAAAELESAAFGTGAFVMTDGRGIVKRRRLDGSVQETMVARPDAQLPPGVPLTQPGEHFLNPDTSATLPIVFGLVPADSPTARRTVEQMDLLWNQGWNDGGYGRYHVTSEPDSPGAWPFASLFVARAAFEAGDYERVWRVLRWLDTVPGAAAGSWFEFQGPRIAPPFPQVGVIPWTWAEMLFLLVFQVLGVRADEQHIRVRPRLPPGLDRVEASLPIRGHWLKLDVRVSSSGTTFCRCGKEATEVGADGAWLIPYRPRDVTVEIQLCH
ncbi:MAG: glycosyl hydrolase family 65 protein [Bacteroidales bacterium]